MPQDNAEAVRAIYERIVNVWKMSDGKCVELRIHSTLDEALEEIG